MGNDVNDMNELYPFTANYFETSQGLKVHYVDEGGRDAPPVLMVHGNPTWSFYWRRLIKALSPTHRTIAPDHIGCGRSDKPGKEDYAFTFESRVDDLTALALDLDLSGITLVVHDWGGAIGMAFAVRHPELVERMVVLNTGAFHLPNAKSFPPSLRLARVPAVGDVLVRGANAFVRGANRFCVTKNPLPKAVAAAYEAPHKSWADRVSVHEFVKDIPLSPSDPAYKLITETQDGLQKLKGKPMLIGWGMRDFVFDHHFLDEWERRFPDAEVHRFEDCGHFIMEDAPDEIVGLVERFVGEA